MEDVVGGYEIITACNGKDGIKAWETFKPDVIISDIDMPVMNGIDMVKHIRELDGETIIMFTTNLTSPSKLKEGYNVGVDEYIKKPFVPEELDCHVKALLKLKGGIERRNVSNCVKIGKHILDSEHTCLKMKMENLLEIGTTRIKDIRNSCQEQKCNHQAGDHTEYPLGK